MKFKIQFFYLLSLSFILCSCNSEKKSFEIYESWNTYRGDFGNNAYSKQSLINVNNVENLEVAWIYKTGDSKPNSSIQCNPIIIEDVLFATTAGLKMIALNAETGALIWEYDPVAHGEDSPTGIGGTNRGLAYWEDGNDKRLYYCFMDEIQAIDASSGKRISEFGIDGVVDLREGLDREFDKETAYIRNTSPGVVYKDLLIMGSSLNEARGALPGHIRAYDVRTGAMQWIFHTIPHPGEFGYDTWPEYYYKTGGGVNAWSGLSIDKERGIVMLLWDLQHTIFMGSTGKEKDCSEIPYWLWMHQQVIINGIFRFLIMIYGIMIFQHPQI